MQVLRRTSSRYAARGKDRVWRRGRSSGDKDDLELPEAVCDRRRCTPWHWCTTIPCTQPPKQHKTRTHQDIISIIRSSQRFALPAAVWPKFHCQIMPPQPIELKCQPTVLFFVFFVSYTFLFYSTHYSTRPYLAPFGHNTQRSRQTDRRRTDRAIGIGRLRYKHRRFRALVDLTVMLTENVNGVYYVNIWC